MRALLRRLTLLRSDDRGIALPVVMGLGLIMLILVATGMTVAINGLRKTDTEQDWNGALDAAFAGVEEYQSRLATDSTYFTYGDATAPFSVLTGSTRLTLPATANAAFGLGATGTWASVPGSTPVASFRYEVDNHAYTTTGGIRLRVTGRVNQVTRSIVADLKQSGFVDYLYFTDYEVQDPDLTSRPECVKHLWEGRPTDCGLNFDVKDTLAGPVHSNDTLNVCGATFKNKVTTSNPNLPIVVTPSGCSAGNYQPGSPAYQAPIPMPPTNGALRTETRTDLTSVPVPGCLYTGPTVITFIADGTMNVRSPWTVKTQVTPTTGTTPAMCGMPGTGTNQLGSVDGANIPTIPSNIVYVQGVPGDSSDPNYPSKLPLPAGSTTPSNFSCINSNAGWMFGGMRFPRIDEMAPLHTTTPYGCKNGDVFIEGKFKGAMTIAAENYTYITGDLTYADTARDILGLASNNAIWVWNPMKATTVGTTTTYTPLLPKDRTIQAAMVSVAHTFQVQNHDVGPLRGTLTVFGSIAQKFRGAVGISGPTNGYVKAYTYDTRLAYLAPPKFLSPVSSSYGISQFADVPAAFLPSGAIKP